MQVRKRISIPRLKISMDRSYNFTSLPAKCQITLQNIFRHMELDEQEIKNSSLEYLLETIELEYLKQKDILRKVENFYLEMNQYYRFTNIMNPKIIVLLDYIIKKNIEDDNLLKERNKQAYIAKMGDLIGYSEITGKNWNVFHLENLRELILLECGDNDP